MGIVLRPDLDLVFSLTIVLLLLWDFIVSLNEKIPIIELVILMYSLQLLLSPALDYNIFNEYENINMVVPRNIYYPYLFKLLIPFVLGLYCFKINQYNVNSGNNFIATKDNKQYFTTGLIFIIIGYVCSYLTTLNLAGTVAFIVTLFSTFKYTGTILLLKSKSKFKYPSIILLLLYCLIEAINSSMFINFIAISLFVFSLLCLIHKPKLYLKIAFTIASIIIIVVLQNVKTKFRETDRSELNSTSSNFKEFKEVAAQNSKKDNIDQYELAQVNYRFNHGYVFGTHMLFFESNPHKIEGLSSEIISLLLPRFLLPNKYSAHGDAKFYDFTGVDLGGGSTWGLGILVEMNGFSGGGIAASIYCFFAGFLFSAIFYLFFKYSSTNSFIFSWFIAFFFYSFRAGDDFYMQFNWVIKISFLLFLFNYHFKRKLKLPN